MSILRPTKIQIIIACFVLLVVVIVLVILQGNKRFNTLTTQISDLNRDISSLQSKLASTSEELNGTIAKTRDTLSDRLNQERAAKMRLKSHETILQYAED